MQEMQEMQEMQKIQEMLKVIRDGKVAVLYSPGYGAGWYTEDVPVEAIFHPDLIEAVERNADKEELVSIAKRLFGRNHYYGGVSGLKIRWISEGTEFKIEGYSDGDESIILKDEQQWITA